ncbi:Protein of unknown function DUF99 [Marine Group I thaumarchaeote SCGC AAA799-E16]|uniref:UPF0215 protein AAA799B03_00097 n=5 Tax=Marine Group I TaxID=905826 RepID=A0A087S9E3_9ARCH|nr:Protein of unknown function DUF99 [Marine Group I thaumarchaeote SCGC AAA799-N04]KER06271.1 Protein of unknown function DUF99 [Marine Group I thaumarchaeote SCGC AAA799-E16]KFM16514.1 Protein of unknown function DUF99 [Marine Group I thaumarchaeote SCGC AAA799-D11]KFM18543.1 Protein of unknown function DUF99 [Marine Group I thaumarchaeote SCGC RSA3]KFM22347.1 Protein of unknown function DUF99 [Marine Group I thaumarchaeote SCGC AAA799-B03]
MRSLHLEKKGLRGLAIAESFKQNSTKSIFSGVVMRRDFVIDGFVFGSATLEGDDATDTILKMYDDLQRPDISYVLISGLIVSMYNIIDIKKLFDTLQIPIIGVSYHDSSGIEDSLKHHFPNSFESKINEYEKLGKREKITLNTSHDVYIRKEGCTLNEVKHLLDDLTLHGSIPEPIRVSQLLAKTLLKKGLSF